MQVLERVQQTIDRHRLADRSTRVVAAVSGGSDSVALVHLLKELDASSRLRLVALAHFNHRLRPTASRDEQFCADLSTTLGLPFIADAGDVAERARREHRSIESAAHRARYDFLERSRNECGADVIALGHTKDDQAETFLLRLVRGAGSSGLSGMHPRVGAFIRPLLSCRRSELKAYLAQRHVAFVHDESNEDVTIPRNRIRAELLPLLERRFNPAIVDVLSDEAALARDQWAFLNGLVDDWWPRVVREEGRTWHVDATALASMPPALGRLLLFRAMTRASGGHPLGFAHVQGALDLGVGHGAPFDAPGQRVERIGRDVVLKSRLPGSRGRERGDSAGTSRFQYPLPVPGEVELRDAGCLVSVEVGIGGRVRDIPCTPEVAVVRRDLLADGLKVRNRRPGDRFRPLGLRGRKKLQDFFIDRKVERAQRDRVPLVVDGLDRIVWVAGYALAEEFRVTDIAQPMLILRLKAVGGSI
jgi:tRNA(Ile)-lysidine synthase